MPVLQLQVPVIAGIDLSLAQKRPVGSTGKAPFVAHPTASGTSVGENHRLRLDAVQHLINTRVIIIVPAVYGTCFLGASIPAVTAIGAVKPDFEHFTVIGQQVTQLRIEIIQIFRRTVIGLMPVPRRKIDGELQPVFPAGVRKFAYDIALPSLIRRIGYAVVCTLEGPKAKTVMMLGGEDHSFHAGVHQGLRPLFAVQPGRVEGSGIGITISPFTVIERIQAEMDKSVCFHFLPLHLFLFGNRQNWFRRLDVRRGTRGYSQSYSETESH